MSAPAAPVDIVPVSDVRVSAYTIPTDAPESDGTLAWKSTTLVLAELAAGGITGMGYTYAAPPAAAIVRSLLAEVVTGRNALDIEGIRTVMYRAVRNDGRQSLVAQAISAVDTALWDLKARLLGVSLLRLLGAVRESIPVYGSGGFTSYDDEQLRQQLSQWAQSGIRRVKIKVGRYPEDDLRRVRVAREAISPATELFVDANGALDRKQALAFAEQVAEYNVTWFEEPVSSDDLAGLRLLRDRAPAGMHIAAGEYGYTPLYFRRMLEAGAVDVLQADASRCGGLSGFLRAGVLCEAFMMPLSSHCCPALHAHVCCAVQPVRHMEYFHDHVRIESMLFDGLPELVDGELRPDSTRAGNGLVFRHDEAARYRL